MRDHKWTLAAFVSRRQVTAVALLIPLTLGAMPANAQDLFGFSRLFSPQVVRAPVYQPYTAACSRIVSRALCAAVQRSS